jgi:hypothetical protein
MKRAKGAEILPQLPDMYRRFLSSDGARHLVVLGRPRVGKRWHLQQVLSEMDIVPHWVQAAVSPESAADVLDDAAGKLLVLYETINPFLTNISVATALLARYPSTGWLDRTPSMNQPGEPRHIGAKCILLDDPYTKLSMDTSGSLDGIVFDFSVRDLLTCVEEQKASLAAEHGVQTGTIDKVLAVYHEAVDRAVVSETEELPGVQFSVHGVMVACKMIDSGEAGSWAMFPQKLTKLAMFRLEDG